MCGLAGFIDKSKDAATLRKMTDAIKHRGPDDSGCYFEDGVALGHRRLSIIDLTSAGHQPMQFGELVIVFNGEVYNYKEIQQQLTDNGYTFQSSSDTEVVIKAFHFWGVQSVTRFIGMFAFAIYNTSNEEMYLFRDRAGVKPLYYYFSNGRFAFASELRCFKHYLTPDERGDLDLDAVSNFLSVGYVSGDHSVIKAIKKLLPGHYLKFHKGKLDVETYWRVNFKENTQWNKRSESDLLDELEDLVVSAFRYRMVADVPVGVFLSSGVDSALVTAVLSKHHGQLRTYTIGFNEAGFDESDDARKIANYLGTHHVESKLTAKHALDIFQDYYQIYDEPHGDTSCLPTAFVSKIAAENGAKVVLSADAGDELFGGYVRYTEYLQRWRQLAHWPQVLRVGAAVLIRNGSAWLGRSRQNKYARIGDILSRTDFSDFYQTIIRSSAVAELTNVFPHFREQLSVGSGGALLEQMCAWDFSNYMPDDILVKVDRATMHYSIEGREPFLDHRLVEFAAQLPNQYKIRNGETKYLLKQLLGRYLPTSLYRLPKRGFGAPLQKWLDESFKDQFFARLSAVHPMFDQKAVNRLIERQRKGVGSNYVLLWYLFSFHLWYDHWIDCAD